MTSRPLSVHAGQRAGREGTPRRDRGARRRQHVPVGVERQHHAAARHQQQVAAGLAHRAHLQALGQARDGEVALVLQGGEGAVAAGLDLEGEAGDLAQRRVHRRHLVDDAVLRPLPRGADRVREAVQPLRDPARPFQRRHLLAGVGGRPAQREEAAAQPGERVRQAVAALRRAVRRLHAGEQVLPRRGARRRRAAGVEPGHQRRVHLPPRFGGAQAHRLAARDQRLLRDRLARVARRLGVGDVLRVLRQPPLHGGEAAPRDVEGEVEAHDGAILARSGLTAPQRRMFSVSWSISSLVVTTRVFAV